MGASGTTVDISIYFIYILRSVYIQRVSSCLQANTVSCLAPLLITCVCAFRHAGATLTPTTCHTTTVRQRLLPLLLALYNHDTTPATTTATAHYSYCFYHSFRYIMSTPLLLYTLFLLLLLLLFFLLLLLLLLLLLPPTLLYLFYTYPPTLVNMLCLLTLSIGEGARYSAAVHIYMIYVHAD